ncbi:MAG: acetyl-CoA carboxylase, carboxyltransferase subunit beta [Pseudomonadota bacterium]
MNWISNFVRPKIQALVNKKDVPDNMWQKCPSCDAMLFYRDLKKNLNVCENCEHHLKIGVIDRLDTLFNDGNYDIADLPKSATDPLKFKDRKRYADRIKESRHKTGRNDAIVVAHGKMGDHKAVVAGFDFAFMGGSMGAAVGDGILTAARIAVLEKAPLIVIPASGGARMQEGALSLMQMPRTAIAVEQVKEAGLPYIVLLTDPTTGGVSASFAMLGDIHIAEPGAQIGFAGRRVIEETIREQLPEGFQTAEYLQDHGMVDMVVSRHKLRDTFISVFDLLMTPFKQETQKAIEDKSTGGKKSKSKTKAKAKKTPEKPQPDVTV